MLRVAEHFERTDTGRQRRGNEDAFYARAPLFAVADGMGGAQAGEVASHLAVEVLEQGLPDGGGSVEERLRARVREANARIMESAHGSGSARSPRSSPSPMSARTISPSPTSATAGSTACATGPSSA